MYSILKSNNPANPRLQASFLSKITFFWLFPFIRHGFKKKDVELGDLYSVLPEMSAEFLGNKLSQSWKHELRLNDPGTPKLWKGLLRNYKWDIIKYTMMGIFMDCICRGVTGISLGIFLEYFSRGSTASITSCIVGGLFVVLSTYAFTISNYFNMNNLDILAMKIRIGLTVMVYRKALKLSQKSLCETGIGQITNILSNDLNRFERYMPYMTAPVVAPAQVIVIAIILYYWIGVSVLSGVALILLLLPAQILIGNRLGKIRTTTAIKTDNRVRLMNEIINGILLIKMSTWENLFAKLVSSVRRTEMEFIRKRLFVDGFNRVLTIVTSRAVQAVILVTFVLTGNSITATQVFMMLTLTNYMRSRLSVELPLGMTGIAESLISLQRIQDFLQLEEVNINDKCKEEFSPDLESYVSLTNASAKWETSTYLNLISVTLNVYPGELCMVVGPVGSGKSTLLQVILRELPLHSGTLKSKGKISYASQTPWIFNGSIRDNILFGTSFDPHWFSSVVKVCGLTHDFKMFRYKEETLIGDKGLALSGGQKARIGLARAIYSDSEVYLLDDTFSALDARVGREIFHQCILNLKRRQKCVILVTHQLPFLEYASKIMVLKNGQIVEAGTYTQIKNSIHLNISEEGVFANEFIIGADAEEQYVRGVDDDIEELSKSISTRLQPVSTSLIRNTSSSGDYGTFEDSFNHQKKVMEHRSTGKIEFSVHWKYFRSGNSLHFILLLFLMPILLQIGLSGSDYWLQVWTDQDKRPLYNATNDFSPELENYNEQYMDIYLMLLGGVLVVAIIRCFILTKQAFNTSTSLHANLFRCVLHAPMRFYELNSYGRIFNRFVNDIGNVDDNLPRLYDFTSLTVFQLIGNMVLIIISFPIMILPSIVMLILFHFIRNIYLVLSSSLKRIELIGRSPIFGSFSSTLTGLSTIRSLKREKNMEEKLILLQDEHTSAYYLYAAGVRCFGSTLEWISNIYLTVLIIVSPFLSSDDSLVGLAVSSALAITLILPSAISMTADLDNNIVSVERILEYSNLEPEKNIKVSGQKVQKSWPAFGRIEYKDVSVKYETGSTVLHSISFKINSSERIGIVGRTGAGKSSLIATLFGIVEPFTGCIHVDGLDISKIGKQTLRSKLSIIPQNPILFSSTVRQNLDPFQEFEDYEIRKVLEQVSLSDRLNVAGNSLLDSNVAEDGSNFSQGEKQLLCLARALLTKNKILVLDEATANIDTETDALIQQTIRQQFLDCTILIVAHRLDTIMDSDRICVMDSGKIIEFENPYLLLQNKKSAFFNLCNQSTELAFQHLLKIATKAFESRNS